MDFKDTTHKDRFEALIEKDETNRSDIDRMTLFYILSGNHKLTENIDLIYDFKNHFIQSNIFNHLSLSSSERGLLELSLNLYNNYSEKENMLSIYEMFSQYDKDNFELAIAAIRYRFFG